MNTIKIKADTKERAIEIWTKKVKAKWDTLKSSQKNGTNAFIYKWDKGTLIGSLKPHHNAGTPLFYSQLADLFNSTGASFDSTTGVWTFESPVNNITSLNSVDTFGLATIDTSSGNVNLYSSTFSATANSDNVTIQASFTTSSTQSGTITNIAAGWYGVNGAGTDEYNAFSNITTSTSIGASQTFGVTIVYTNQG